MRPSDLAAAVFDAGPDDRAFDVFLLLGPVVVGLVAALGRSRATEVLAATYVGAFVAYALYRGVR